MRHVFISFRAEDRMRVNGLRLLAANSRFEIEFYDEPVRTAIDSHNATYIRSKIREKISRTSVTLCMVSDLTYTSTWVDWEIEESIDKGNNIFCMGFPNGPGRLHLPEPARRLQLPWYRWDVHHLQQLIDASPAPKPVSEDPLKTMLVEAMKRRSLLGK